MQTHDQGSVARKAPGLNGVVEGSVIQSITRRPVEIEDPKIQALKAISKIVDHVQGRDVNRFKNGVYTLVFEYFESVYNKALGR